MSAVNTAMRAFEFEVDGRISEQAREAFCDMRITERPEGAVLHGTVIDESHLLGILAQCRVLGLRVVSARRSSPPSSTPPTGSPERPTTDAAAPPGDPAPHPGRAPARPHEEIP